VKDTKKGGARSSEKNTVLFKERGTPRGQGITAEDIYDERTRALTSGSRKKVRRPKTAYHIASTPSSSLPLHSSDDRGDSPQSSLKHRSGEELIEIWPEKVVANKAPSSYGTTCLEEGETVACVSTRNDAAAMSISAKEKKGIDTA